MTAPHDASFNPNPKWPGGWVQVLRDQGIEEGNIPHFLRWVRSAKLHYDQSRSRPLRLWAVNPLLASLPARPWQGSSGLSFVLS